jgi:hypothetical protein
MVCLTCKMLAFTLVLQVHCYRNLARNALITTNNLEPYDEYSKLAAINDGVMTYCNTMSTAETTLNPGSYPCLNNFESDDYRWINNFNYGDTPTTGC